MLRVGIAIVLEKWNLIIVFEHRTCVEIEIFENIFIITKQLLQLK